MSWKKLLTETPSASDIASSPSSGKVLKVGSGGALEWSTDSGGSFTTNGTIASFSGTEAKVKTTTANAVGVILELAKDSASPATNDEIGKIAFTNNIWDSSGEEGEIDGSANFAQILATVTNVESGAIAGKLEFKTVHADTLATRLTIESSGNLTASADSDKTFSFGRAKIFSAVSDYMYLSHHDLANGTNYALKQNSAGATVLNSKAGSTLSLSINNTNEVTIDDTKTTFAGYAVFGSGTAIVGNNSVIERMSEYQGRQGTNSKIEMHSTGDVSIRSSSTDDAFYIKDDGKIAIGHNTPTSLIDIKGSATDSSINIRTQDDTVGTQYEGARVRFAKNSDGFLGHVGYRYYSATDKGVELYSSDDINFRVAGSDNHSMRINSSGIELGRSYPFQFTDAWTGIIKHGGNNLLTVNAGANGPVSISGGRQVNLSGKLNISSDKLWMVGNNTSGNVIDMHSYGGVNWDLRSYYDEKFIINYNSGTAGSPTYSPAFVIHNRSGGGKIGIGVATPTTQLHVEGNVTGNYATQIINAHSNGLGLMVRGGASSGNIVLGLQNSTQATVWRANLDGSTSQTGDLTVTAGDIKLKSQSSSTYFKLEPGGTTTYFHSPIAGKDITFKLRQTSSEYDLLHLDASDQRVGISTTTPTEKLDVGGTINATNYKVGGAQGSDGQVLTSTGSGVAWEAIPASGATWTESGSNAYRSSGNVGIGVTSPSDTLHVYKGSAGNSGMQIQSTGSGTSSVTYLDFVHADGTWRVQNQADKLGFYDISSSRMRWEMHDGGIITTRTEGSHYPLNIYSYGNSARIGITATKGTQDSPVDINEDGFLLGGLDFYGWEANSNRRGASILGYTAGVWTSTSYPADLAFLTTPASSTTNTEIMRITSDGQVKVNVPNTNNKGIFIGTSASILWGNPELQYNVDAGKKHRWNIAGSEEMLFDATNGLDLKTNKIKNWNALQSQGNLYLDNAGTIDSRSSGDLTFRTTDALTTRMIIKNAGNVGIHTDTPSEKLTVNGNINLKPSDSKLYWHDKTVWVQANNSDGITSYVNSALKFRAGSSLNTSFQHFASDGYVSATYFRARTINENTIIRGNNTGIDVDIQDVAGTSMAYFEASNKRVGINTTSPLAPLHLSGLTTASGSTQLRIEDSRTGDDSIFAGGYVAFHTKHTGADKQLGYIAYSQDGNQHGAVEFKIRGTLSGTGNKYLCKNRDNGVWYFYNNWTEDLAMVIKDQKVGIGGVTPARPLEVVGTGGIITTQTASGNSTNKAGIFGTRHYNTSEQEIAGLFIEAENGTNAVSVGGGSGAFNASTVLKFFTSANSTTVQGTERMRISSSGHVGINTTAPDAPLHIKAKTNGWDGSIVLEENDDGTANMITRNDDNLWFGYAPDASDVGANAVQLMVIKEDGKVGIHHSNPQESLDISGGNIRLDNDQHIGWATTDGQQGRCIIRANESTDTMLFRVDNATRLTLTTSGLTVNDKGVKAGLGSGANGGYMFHDFGNTYGFKGLTNADYSSSAGSRLGVVCNDVELMTWHPNGVVGINTDNPQRYLEVKNKIADNENPQLRLQAGATTSAWYDFGVPDVSGDRLRIKSSSSASTGIVELQGIQTLNFKDKNFSIMSSNNFADCVFQAGSTRGFVFQANQGAINAFKIAGDGKVGVGTTSPAYTFDVSATGNLGRFTATNGGGHPILYLSNGAGSINSGTILQFDGGSASGQIKFNGISSTSSEFSILTETSGSLTEKMKIDESGYVGIGTDSPSSHLHINNSGGGATVFVDGDTGSWQSFAFKSGGSTKAEIKNFHETRMEFTQKVGEFRFIKLSDASVLFKIDSNSQISLSNNDSGTANTIFGKNAGSNVSGGYSVLIGDGAGEAITSNYGNVAIGWYAGNTCDAGGSASAFDNVFVGKQTGRFIDDGQHNVAIGAEAMRGANAGGGPSGAHALYNVAVGRSALYAISSGDYNVALGGATMWNTTTGSNSVAIGYSAGYSAVSAQDWVYIGYEAGYYGTGNHYSTYVGYQSGKGSGSGGEKNSALGKGTLQNTNGGSENVAVGYEALNKTTSGDNNVALGRDALYTNTTTSGNTAVGYKALYTLDFNNTNSPRSVAVGSKAGYSLDGGYDLTAIGNQAGEKSDDNYGNTYVGVVSGQNIDDGNYNTAVGGYALQGADADANDASYNVAVGYNSLKAVTDGDKNTSLGNDSSKAITTGSNNTSIGNKSNEVLTTGDLNVYIGAFTKSSAVNISNEIVIGTGADDGSDYLLGQGNDKVVIGSENGYIWNDFSSNATWTNPSDERIKKDIKDSDLGLSFINDLRPVTYKKKPKSEYPKSFDDYNEKKTTVKDKKLYGFIAQEVKEAMDKASHSDFTAWTEGKDGMQGLGVTELITPLVKAVQELSAEIDKLKEQLNKES